MYKAIDCLCVCTPSRKWTDQQAIMVNHLYHQKEEESRQYQAQVESDGLTKLAVVIQIRKATEVVPFVARAKITVRVDYCSLPVRSLLFWILDDSP
jgi:hypothetical protein